MKRAICVLVVVLGLVCAAQASSSWLLYDEFNSDPLNSSRWWVPDGHVIPVVSGGVLKFESEYVDGGEDFSSYAATIYAESDPLLLSSGIPPSVSNVSAVQTEGTKKVSISYDVSSDGSVPVTISVQVQNGAEPISAVSLTGDVGAGILPGVGKSIEWDMGADWSGNVAQDVEIIVTAIAEGGADGPEMVTIPSGVNSGVDPDYGAYSLTNEVAFKMDKFEVTNDEMVRVMQWAYDQGKITVSASGVTNVSGDAQELLDLDGSECRITWSNSVFGMKSAKGSGYPCVEVSWYGAAAYCNYRSELDGKTPCYDLSDWSVDVCATGYRLPSSDEWEYAARGGLSGKRFPWGDTVTHSNANYYSHDSYSYDISPTREYHPDYKDGGYPYTSPSEIFAPNGYGLHDMAGNVWEWCNTTSGSGRGIRGGSWINRAYGLRCGFEYWDDPDDSYGDIGFRTVSR